MDANIDPPEDEFREVPCPLCSVPELPTDGFNPSDCHEDCYARYLRHHRAEARRAMIRVDYRRAHRLVERARQYLADGRPLAASDLIAEVEAIREGISLLRKATMVDSLDNYDDEPAEAVAAE